ncbi:hypothetical protein EYC84_010800 [Monilinia fructicola]|uniref:Uncharacterized protein n=1 Tax=Monilinia fructicola TaxID=38448 RepID=A0A5M9J861_MONFR|nr:hypothetical protein EYC84_010800 [Monilinia fructicola]
MKKPSETGRVAGCNDLSGGGKKSKIHPRKNNTSMPSTKHPEHPPKRYHHHVLSHRDVTDSHLPGGQWWENVERQK